MNRDLIQNILEATKNIHRSSIKGSGSFIVTSSQAANYFRIMYVGERIKKCKKILNKIKNK